METTREEITLKRTLLERIIDTFVVVFTLGVLIYFMSQWSSFPDSVPIHFSDGEPDRWGSPLTILILPIIGFIHWFVLTILEKFPEKHNYLWLTDNNREKQYRNSQLLVWYLKNSIFFYFSIITIELIQLAKEQKMTTLNWTLPLFLATIFGLLFLFTWRSYKMRDDV